MSFSIILPIELLLKFLSLLNPAADLARNNLLQAFLIAIIIKLNSAFLVYSEIPSPCSIWKKLYLIINQKRLYIISYYFIIFSDSSDNYTSDCIAVSFRAIFLPSESSSSLFRPQYHNFSYVLSFVSSATQHTLCFGSPFFLFPPTTPT